MSAWKCYSIRHDKDSLPTDASLQQDRPPGTGLGTFPAQGAFERCVQGRVGAHDAAGAGLHTFQALDAEIVVHLIDPLDFSDGLHRADLGTGPALVAELDAVDPWLGKQSLNPKHRLGRAGLLKIDNGTGQQAGPAAGTVFMNGSKLHDNHLQ